MDNTRFESRSPRAAAFKAIRRIYSEGTHKKEIRFVIQETTSNSNKKRFTYMGAKFELAQPKVVNIAGKEVVYKYEFEVRREFHEKK